MLKLIVLGIVPGTQYILSFEDIFFAMLGFYSTLGVYQLGRKLVRRSSPQAKAA